MIDHEPLIRSLLVDELRSAGLGSHRGCKRVEAWALLSQGEKIDVVFSELRTPGAIDGLTLQTRMREHYPSIPRILTSGSAPPEIRRLGELLQKPYSIIGAIQIVMALLPRANDRRP